MQRARLKTVHGYLLGSSCVLLVHHLIMLRFPLALRHAGMHAWCSMLCAASVYQAVNAAPRCQDWHECRPSAVVARLEIACSGSGEVHFLVGADQGA